MCRRAPRYYGSTCSSFTNTDSPEVAGHVYLCTKSEKLKVRDKMNWYVTKGMAIKPSDASFSRKVRITQGEEPCFVFTSSLYACDLDEAPEYKWQNPNGTLFPTSPLFHSLTSKAIYHVCTLTSDLSCIPRSKFSIFTNSKGEKFWHVEFIKRMTLVNEVSAILCEQLEGEGEVRLI